MRYFFHLHNDVISHDDEGSDFADDQAARTRAIREARVMAADSVIQGHLRLGDYIRVTDGSDVEVFRVPFGEAVRITP